MAKGITNSGGGGLNKSVIIVTDLPSGSTVTATGWTKNAVTTRPMCSTTQYAPIFGGCTFDRLPIGTKVMVSAVIRADAATQCYFEVNGIGNRRVFDLETGDNRIQFEEITTGELPSANTTGSFYKLADDVQVCGVEYKLYSRKVDKTAVEKDGEWWLRNLDLGEWTLDATLGSESASTKFSITQFGVFYVPMGYGLYPDDFTFEGTKGEDYEVMQDDDTVIPVEDYRKYKNWKVRVFTTTIITPKKSGYVDAFVLGGGGSGGFSGNSGPTGSGGGSGYAITYKKVLVEANVPITITIGAGGTYPTTDTKGNDGGETSFGELKAAGGIGGGNKNNPGGNGGSGGNGKWADETRPEERGIDGSDGYKRGTGSASTEPGKGQKNQSGPNGETGNTREFGDPSGKLYAYGGYASGPAAAKPKEANTGDGGDSGGNTSKNNGVGGSGIVVFRNAREGVA